MEAEGGALRRRRILGAPPNLTIFALRFRNIASAVLNLHRLNLRKLGVRVHLRADLDFYGQPKHRTLFSYGDSFI
jgi:hypothetical protein